MNLVDLAKFFFLKNFGAVFDLWAKYDPEKPVVLSEANKTRRKVCFLKITYLVDV